MKLENELPLLFSKAGYEFLWNYIQEQRNLDSQGYDSGRLVFLGFCMTNLLHSKAQLLQDLYVMYKLNSKRDGFFVEFGAAGGVNLSNTFLLEKQGGWRGILAEPFPLWHDSLAINRKVIIDHRCVWSQSGEQLEFLGTEHAPEYATILDFRDADKYGVGRSRSNNVITVESISLNDLLFQHSAPIDIDYLSVDTEGSEFEILNNLDFARYHPRVITVEHNFNSVLRDNLNNLLVGNGYVREFEELSMFDDWYFLPK